MSYLQKHTSSSCRTLTTHTHTTLSHTDTPHTHTHTAAYEASHLNSSDLTLFLFLSPPELSAAVIQPHSEIQSECRQREDTEQRERAERETRDRERDRQERERYEVGLQWEEETRTADIRANS